MSKRLNLVPVTYHPGKRICSHPGELFELLRQIEPYSHLFDTDFLNPETNYQAWSAAVLDFVEDSQPWFHLVTSQHGRVLGCVWATDWELVAGQEYACEIGGFTARGESPFDTLRIIRQTVEKLFTESSVEVIRGTYGLSNRAAKVALLRAGFCVPEGYRAYRKRNGQYEDGEKLSLTREEWETTRPDDK